MATAAVGIIPIFFLTLLLQRHLVRGLTFGAVKSAAMATVELRRIWKKYGEVEAVRDLSLTCKDGEFLRLLGPSGCGKSSTMRMVAGLERITSGELLMDGRRINDMSPRDRDIAMVFENYALYPHLNVYDNIAMPLRARRLPSGAIDRKIREVADILHMADLLPRRIQNLSGGQKQRVGIGRAIVREPRLFIMDEPISHSRGAAARRHAHRAETPPPPPGGDHAVRHP